MYNKMAKSKYEKKNNNNETGRTLIKAGRTAGAKDD
jgi:hypothetical protein